MLGCGLTAFFLKSYGDYNVFELDALTKKRAGRPGCDGAPICIIYNKRIFLKFGPNFQNFICASLSHVYHMYHVPYFLNVTNVCFSNLPRKCDQPFCDSVSCVAYVSCTICSTYNKCMCRTFAQKM